jgi:hypothetical protein
MFVVNSSVSSPILVALMMVVICSFEILVLTRATWHNIIEDGILHNHCRANLKSYRRGELWSTHYPCCIESRKSLQSFTSTGYASGSQTMAQVSFHFKKPALAD